MMSKFLIITYQDYNEDDILDGDGVGVDGGGEGDDGDKVLMKSAVFVSGLQSSWYN